MRTPSIVGLIVTLGAACGGSSEPTPGAAAAPAAPAVPPPPASELHTEHLPPTLSYVSFGETTPEQVRPRYVADNLMISDHMAIRGLMPQRTLGPNSGRLTGMVNVVRKTNVDGYIGAFGDDYGSVAFYFTPLANGQPPVLYKLEVAQVGTAGNVCQPAAALAAGAGLEGCDPNDLIHPSAPNAAGEFYACIDHTGGRVIAVRCMVSGQTRILSYELAVGQVSPPATAVPPAAAATP